MDKYYYFVSELPYLRFDTKPLIDREYFLEEAKKWLSQKDFATVSQVDINNFCYEKKDSPVVNKYKSFERNLRERLALIRKSLDKAKETKISEILGIDFNGSPLEIETQLLFLRWQFISEQEKDHYFDLDTLIFYFLKLQILKRLFIFDKDKGTAAFDELCGVNIPQD
jgi:hypothetical protein